MSKTAHRKSIKCTNNRTGVFWLFGWLVLGTLLFWQAAPGKGRSEESAIVASSADFARRLEVPQSSMKPIGFVQVGDRLHESARNPLLSDTERNIPEPNPATSRLLKLRLVDPDGETVDIEMIESLDWIAETNAEVGATIHLDLAELGAEGPAEVLAIEPCPEIKPGKGPIVTAKFTHWVKETIGVYVEQREKPIGVTPNHPFWSEDRQAFVPAGELQTGEQLRTKDGRLVCVTKIIPRAGPKPVYNLQVHGEQVYQVTELGLLVHNNKARRVVNALKRFWRDERGSIQFPGRTAPRGTTALSTFPKARNFANSKLFKNHYKKHVLEGREWGDVISEKAYLARAKKLLSGPAGKDVLEYRRFNGDIVRFNKRTGEYGIVTQDGVIRTIFRPQPNLDKGITNGLDYFLQDRLKQIGF